MSCWQTASRNTVRPSILLWGVLLTGLATAGPAGPRLFFAAKELATRRAAWEKGWLRAPQALLLRNAAKLSAAPAIPYRTHGAVTARAAQYQILTLGLAAHLEPDSGYPAKGREYLLAFCRAVPVEQTAKLHGALGVGDSAHALAVGRDWLSPWLSEAERSEVDKRLASCGEWLFTESKTAFWGQDERRRQAHNWAAVTHGGLGLAALALGDKPEWLASAKHQISRYFAFCRDRDGAPYEGMSYGAYGLQNAVAFAVSFRRLKGVDLLAGQDGPLHAPDHLLWHVLPWGGTVVPHNQSSATLKPAGGMMHLIARSQSRTGLWGWQRLLGPDGDRSYGWSSWLGSTVSLPYVLLFADPTLEPLHPDAAKLPLSRRFARGQVALRDGWTANSSLVTLTCGEGIPGVWNQGDEGSFTFATRQENFVVDTGSGRGRTADHNAILIDGKGQASDGGPAAVQGTIRRCEDFGDWCVVEADATRAYRHAPAKRVRRRVVFIRRGGPVLILVDEIVGSGKTHRFEWLLHTAPGNTIERADKGFTILGARKGALCDVRVLDPPQPVLKTDPGPRNAHLRIQTEGAKARFVVVLSPRLKGDPARLPELRGEQLRFPAIGGAVPAMTVDLADGQVTLAGQ